MAKPVVVQSLLTSYNQFELCFSWKVLENDGKQRVSGPRHLFPGARQPGDPFGWSQPGPQALAPGLYQAEPQEARWHGAMRVVAWAWSLRRSTPPQSTPRESLEGCIRGAAAT